jgi:hypothetical protein
MPITTKDAPGGKSKPTAADETAAAPAAEETMATKTSSKREAAIYVANATGVTTVDGEMFQFRSGVTHVTGDDPAYKAHPDLFSAVADKARPVIEKATAAPGEKRGEK